MCNHICFYLCRKRGSGLRLSKLIQSKFSCLRGSARDVQNFMSKLIITYRILYPFIPFFPFLRIFRIKRICFFKESVSLIKEHARTLSLRVGDCFNQLIFFYALWQLNLKKYFNHVLTQSRGDSICIYIVSLERIRAAVQAQHTKRLNCRLRNLK